MNVFIYQRDRQTPALLYLSLTIETCGYAMPILRIRKNVQFYFAILELMQTVLSVYILAFNLVTYKQKW